MKPDSWLVPLKAQKNHAIARLVIFPHAGGSAAAFAEIAALLPAGLEVFAIEYPGHGRRFIEPSLLTISELAAPAAEMCESLSDLPLLILGHSMGSFVAFEACRRLTKRSIAPPVSLTVSACRSPNKQPRPPFFHLMSDTELVEECRRLDGMTPELLEHRELVEILISVIKNDSVACTDYLTSDFLPQIDIPVFAYRGVNDEDATLEDMSDWGSVTKNKCVHRVFDGGHFYYNSDRDSFMRSLSEDLLSALLRSVKNPAGESKGLPSQILNRSDS